MKWTCRGRHDRMKQRRVCFLNELKREGAEQAFLSSQHPLLQHVSQSVLISRLSSAHKHTWGKHVLREEGCECENVNALSYKNPFNFLIFESWGFFLRFCSWWIKNTCLFATAASTLSVIVRCGWGSSRRNVTFQMLLSALFSHDGVLQHSKRWLA